MGAVLTTQIPRRRFCIKEQVSRMEYSLVEPYTATGEVRVTALVDAVRQLIADEVPGAFIECGVWKGGSMMAVAFTLLELDVTNRELYLFDTFSGPDPTEMQEIDRDYKGVLASKQYYPGWYASELKEVQGNMQRTGYPEDCISYVVGRVQETVPKLAPEQIALLRLDTDYYESTRHELEHLWSRLSPGGTLLIDDYGHFDGCRKAVDEFLIAEGITEPLTKIDYAARLLVKRAD